MLLGGVDEVVPIGVLDPGMSLAGILLGGRVLGVAVPVGEHGFATVAEVLAPPAVEGVEPAPLVDAVVPVLLELEPALPAVVPVPGVVVLPVVVVQGPTVPVVPLPGVVPPTPVVVWLGVVVVLVLGLVVVVWPGVVVVLWLGVVVVVVDGVTPVADGVV